MIDVKLQVKNLKIVVELYKLNIKIADIKIINDKTKKILYFKIKEIILSKSFVSPTKESFLSLVSVRYPLSLPIDKNLFFLWV